MATAEAILSGKHRTIDKRIILLVIIAIAAVSLFLYYKDEIKITIPESQGGTKVQVKDTTEEILKQCNQTNIISNVMCSSRALAGNGYIDEARNLCNALEDDKRKRCLAGVLSIDGKRDEAMDLCNAIEDSATRSICTADIINRYEGSDSAMEICKKIANATMRNRCTRISVS